ncbi:MAG TPA: DUF3300 domain-containing protein [Rhizomicrobium sp.]|nr:DUF3300 domain-containing protein [Rhizomicrobium sp.]
MQTRPVRVLTCALIGAMLGISIVAAQDETPPPPAAPVAYSEGQLDQLTSPIALYPDPLVSEILMASTYPLEVVEADRWVENPDNAALQGDQLTAALGAQSWDPSVKSLVPYPPVLRMLDDNLEWTEALGDAFIADQAGVMDSIQRLRAKAQSDGYLSSTPQQTVTAEDQDIVIEPVNADYFYLPVCDPASVYGVWPYPDYPPYYFTGYYPDLTVGAFGCGWWEGPIFAPYWGWNRWDWRNHRIVIDRGRFTALNGNRPPPGNNNSWHYDPAHRHDVPHTTPALQRRFGGTTPPDIERSDRGYASPDIQHSDRGFTSPDIERSDRGFAPPSMTGQARAFPPVFESFDRGSDVGADAMRGFSSRMSMGGGHGFSGGGGGHR